MAIIWEKEETRTILKDNEVNLGDNLPYEIS